jgi:hypothetical protein
MTKPRPCAPFVLGAGLHSYGFGTGGLPVVATFVGLEVLFLVAAIIRRKQNVSVSINLL